VAYFQRQPKFLKTFRESIYNKSAIAPKLDDVKNLPVDGSAYLTIGPDSPQTICKLWSSALSNTHRTNSTPSFPELFCNCLKKLFFSNSNSFTLFLLSFKRKSYSQCR